MTISSERLSCGLNLSSCDVVARFDLDGVLIELVPTAERRLVGESGNARLTDDIRRTAELHSRGATVSSIHRVTNGSLARSRIRAGMKLVLWQSD